jgi:hypothetical protein
MESIMHTKVSSSRSGVKLIHVPHAIAATTLAASTLHALVELTKEHPHTGVNLWAEYDEDEEMLTYHCEVGSKQFQSTDLACCILEANGQLPTKQCPRCTFPRSINSFPRDRKSPDGRGSLCHIHNRLQVKATKRKSKA